MGNTNWNPWVKVRRERRKKKEKEKEEGGTLKLGEKGWEDEEDGWSVCDYDTNMLYENLRVEK